ncbi:MAG: hypothetical protein JST54_18725 [Deltaproteobacteria bacterium]|nr:hypothetical protein [Deltaproteobacteria bacterium]
MRRAVFVLAIAGLWGCSSPTTEGASGSTTAATATGGSGASSGSTGGSGSGSTGGSSGSTTGSSGGSTTGNPSARYAGYVLFTSLSAGNVLTRDTITVAFTTADAGATLDPANCIDGILDTNGCCYREAGGINRDGGFNLGDGGFSAGDGGGQITAGEVDTTSNGHALATFQPAGGLYAPNALTTWNPGDDLGVTAVGAEVHAFSGSVVAPTSATINSPAVGGLPPPQISTSTALLVSWTGSGNKAAVVLANATFTKYLTCYGANNGQRTISSATLQQYFSPLSGQFGVLGVGVGNVTTATADNANVTIAADTVIGGAIQFQ